MKRAHQHVSPKRIWMTVTVLLLLACVASYLVAWAADVFHAIQELGR